jgi:hypothetical protein
MEKNGPNSSNFYNKFPIGSTKYKKDHCFLNKLSYLVYSQNLHYDNTNFFGKFGKSENNIIDVEPEKVLW